LVPQAAASYSQLAASKLVAGHSSVLCDLVTNEQSILAVAADGRRLAQPGPKRKRVFRHTGPHASDAVISHASRDWRGGLHEQLHQSTRGKGAREEGVPSENATVGGESKAATFGGSEYLLTNTRPMQWLCGRAMARLSLESYS
jgi:hypothetical protein